MNELSCEYLSVWCIWLYVIMSRTSPVAVTWGMHFLKKNKIPLGATWFLKYSNILTRFLEVFKPYTLLLVRKFKFSWLLKCFFIMLMIVNWYRLCILNHFTLQYFYKKKIIILITVKFVGWICFCFDENWRCLAFMMWFRKT